MPRNRHTPEQIIGKLREAEVGLAGGQTVPEVCRTLEITEQTYYRWRREYGGLKVEQARRFRWAREHRLESVNPICNLDVLTDALLNHTSWLDRLRAVPGIRDILTHKPHYLQISPMGSRGAGEEKISWRATANLMMEPPQKFIDLFPALAEILDGACIFMERFCESVGLADGYQQGDYLMLTGQDNDIVGFWPPIEGTRDEFPLMD